MPASSVQQDAPVALEAVLCTDELKRRPSRSPDYQTENRALVALAQALADSPRTILQTLADTILDVLRAGSAGVSLVTEDRKRFYWPAIAGAWKPHIGGGTPRNFGPCGDVLDRNAPLMFSRLQRRYTYFQPVDPQVEEAILVPFYVRREAVGTIWAVSHDDSRKFDAEDMRQLESLGRFASAAFQIVRSLDKLEDEGGALRASERQFREMIDALPAAIYTTDAQGRITHFNPACVAFSGRTPELGTDHWCVTWKLYYPDGTPMPHDKCPMAIALREGRTVRGAEAIAERPDGSRVCFEPYPTTLRDGTGKIVGGINMLVDITARKQAERANAHLAAIVEGSADAIVSKDLSGIITSWNGGAERLFGYTAAEALGRSVTMLIPPDRVDEEPGILARIGRGERIDHYETIRRRKDGTLLDVSLTVSPVFDSHGKAVGASKIARDITERKLAEERLRVAKREAEAASRAKDMFLAVLSHELRTPLAPVFMTLTALELKGDIPRDVQDDVAMMRRNVELEVKLIDDLLDISRITSGKLRLTLERLNVNDLVRHACDTCSSNIREKGIQLQCELDDDVCEIMGDAARLQQVLWNLLNNAAKFTPEGGHIRVATQNADGGRVRITVRDTGIGVAPEILPRIFDAFEQGEVRITRQFGGLGLGLAISKLLVERHQGSIRAESDGPNKGTTFVVEVPALSREESASRPSRSRPVSGVNAGPLRLMVVEDHADTATVLARLLGARGHTVTTATTAAAALALASQGDFDVVISDLGLPDMTGYELMRRLKTKYGTKGIAMSGYGMEDDIRKGEQAGFSDHLVKPINFAQLEQTIWRVLAATDSTTS
jgi:PAS domain S-box-containing protein